MLIWRGWGGLVPLVFFGAAFGLGALIVPSHWALASAIGFAVAGAASIVFGQWVNGTRAAAQEQEFIERRRRELAHLVESGQYRPGDGPPPRSLQEARDIAAVQLQAETAAISGALRNRHALFFVPVQYVGYLGIAVAVILMIASPFVR